MVITNWSCGLAFDVHHAVTHPTPKCRNNQWGLGFLSASVLGPWAWLSGIRWRRHLSTRGSGTASGLRRWHTGCPDFQFETNIMNHGLPWLMFPSSFHSPQWEEHDDSAPWALRIQAFFAEDAVLQCVLPGLVEQRCQKLLWPQAGSTLGSRREKNLDGISTAQLVGRPVPFSHSTRNFLCLSFAKVQIWGCPAFIYQWQPFSFA